MGEEEKLLFVRESSGLVKEVGTGFAIMLPIAGCLGPWFQYGGVHISTWNPGATLSAMFILGTIAIFFEAIADMCLMLAMPRSGAAYYFTGRGLSPIFGVMEGWRSVITNPVFRGTGSFSAFFMLVSGIKIIGYASASPDVVTALTFGYNH